MMVKAAYRYDDNGVRKPVALIQYLQAATKPGEQPAIVILSHLENPPHPGGTLSAATFDYPDKSIVEWDEENDFMPPALLFGGALTRVLNPAHLSAYTGELDALAAMTRKLQATADELGDYEELYKGQQARFDAENIPTSKKIVEYGDQRDTESLALRTIALALHREKPEITDFGGLKITSPLELVYVAETVVLHILNQVKEGHMSIRAAQRMLNLDKSALKPAQKALDTFEDDGDISYEPPAMLQGWPISAKRAQNTLIQWKRLDADSAIVGDTLEQLRATFREENAE